ncbi:MAG: molybdenum cofactor guanylyltransferase, partial [Mariprofundaceae bacterium]|nr:molybdenum cofactor guanylyltransferase [Mariprofundaceae bacterium]
GGESRRMGRDKADIELHGKTLLQHAGDALAPLFSEVLVSVHAPRCELKLPQVVDDFAGRGPMVGIASALSVIQTDWLFVVGCDMPYLSAPLLRHMAGMRQGHAAVVAEIGGHLQPMPAFYAKETCLPAMQTALEQSRRSLMRLIPSLHTAILHEHDLRPFDRDLRSFTDFDTPEDLAACYEL